MGDNFEQNQLFENHFNEFSAGHHLDFSNIDSRSSS